MIDSAPVFPLSPLQQGMLFHHLVEPQAGNDIEQLVLTLPEPIDAGALAQSWQIIAQRTEILRTSLRWDRSDMQSHVVAPAVTIPFVTEDLRSLTAPRRAERIRDYLSDDRRRGFKLDQPPLLRLTLFRTEDDAYELVWTVHHILLDGRSFVNVLHEVFAVYEALVRAAIVAALEPVPVYRDYIAWLAQQDFASAETFWRERLRDFYAATPLPAADVDRAAVADDDRQRDRTTRLDAATTNALVRVAAQNDVTLTTLVHVAWAIVLARHSGESDIVFGAARAGRTSWNAAADRAIGLFINTLPMRVRVDADQPISGLLADVRAHWTGMREHEHTPLSLVRRWSDVRGSAPLFESIVVFERRSIESALQSLGGAWKRRALRLYEQTGYPLALTVFGDDELWMRLQYDAERFDDAAAERMLGHFATVLAGFAAGIAQRVSDLPWLTAAERETLAGWSRARLAATEDTTPIERFARVAAGAPDAVAVVCDDQRLTYRELAERSQRLAQHLRSRGVGPGVAVALCVEPSFETVVAILGVMETGGYYVPLDPAYPQERLAFMLADTAAAVVVTTAALRATVPASAAEIVVLDRDLLAQPTPLAAPGALRAGPDDLAYVIYTSGSTGTPKGVMVTNRNVARLLTATESDFAFRSDDVWTLFHSYAFDFSVWELWGALAYGAKLVVVPYWVGRSPDDFHALLERERVTILNQTPSAFRQLMRVDANRPARLDALRLIIFGGEALDVRMLEAWITRYGDDWPQLVNMYGITETTVHVTTRRIRGSDLASAVRSPIGRAIPDLRLHVLDHRQRPVPIGVAGELYVGGPGVARGYLNRAELTAERFMPDAGDAAAQGRLYRSGDRVRWLPDGSLEYLGRVDDQLKVRGFRIEPGEIEAVLRAHPSLVECVVSGREVAPGELRLVAYVVAQRDAALAPRALRAWLEARVPAHFVPAQFVVVDALALTPSGKVDRRRLPEPPRPSLEEPDADVEPATPVERTLAAIWGAALRTPRVGRNDNFFELGGDSIVTISIVARAREAGLRITPRQLFEHPTIASLARVTGEIASASPSSETAPRADAIRPRSLSEPARLSFGQETLWLLERATPGLTAYNAPATRRLHGRLDRAALQGALDGLAARHAALRTTIDASGTEPLLVVQPAVEVPVAFRDVRSFDPAEREAAAVAYLREAMGVPFDLLHERPLRVALARIGDDDYVLLLMTHHIASDGRSYQIMFAELAQRYAAHVSGRPVELPPLAIDYADYAAWQRERLSTTKRDELAAFWRAELARRPAALALPFDRPRPLTPGYAGATAHATVSAEIVSELRDLAQRSDATLYLVLLAAFVTLLARYTGQDDIVVGAPLGARPRRELDAVVGYFVNTLPIRIRFDANARFTDVLAATRRAFVDVLDHQDLPYELVAGASEGDAASGTLLQTVFDLQQTANDVARGPLRVEPFEIDADVAKFDLTCTATEHDASLDLAFEYRTELFDGATIRRMTAHLLTVLESVVASPTRRIAELPLMRESERLAIVRSENQSAAAFPLDVTLVELAEAQAARTPLRVAVEWQQPSGDVVQLTHAALHDRANSLAQELRARGVGPATGVGICAERSPALVIAVLAVLKAGGYYVPLDPGYPSERLAFMLDDSGVHVLLTDAHTAPNLPKRAVELLLIDDYVHESSAGRSGPEPRTARSAQPTDPAYMMYTSGSTGLPKGVSIAHRSIVNQLLWLQERYAIGADDVLLQSTPFSFDSSVSEMLLPLLTGARVVILRPGGHRDGAYFVETITARAVTLIDVVPSALRALVAQPSLTACTSLRQIICGGEKLPPELVTAYYACGLAATLHNHYGPTEAAIQVAYWPCPREWPTHMAIPIGRPVANTQLYVLDLSGEPVPVGVPGELHVGGVQVGLGYWKRPELTAQKFVPDPFGSDPDARLYKTGDLARYRNDGAIDYLGRLDDQVKMRGFRIELGEIESVLADYAGVVGAAVAVRETCVENAELVAYYVAGDDIEPAALRSHLRARLPDHMVPYLYVRLAALPLGPSGKLDRNQLPEPGEAARSRTAAYVAPRSATESIVANIVADVLGLPAERVGIDDNFFEAGGHSLLAMRVVTRVGSALRTRIAVRDFFEAPTMRGLAAATIASAPAGRIEAIASAIARLEAMSSQERERRLRNAPP